MKVFTRNVLQEHIITKLKYSFLFEIPKHILQCKNILQKDIYQIKLSDIRRM